MQVSLQNIIFVIVTVTIILLIVAIFILLYVGLYNQKKKQHIEEKLVMAKEFEMHLLQAQIEVQEVTYTTLSKELHDNIGQLLSTAKMLLNLTERNIVSPPDTLFTANVTIGQAISELRTLTKSLDKDWLAQFDFRQNLLTEVSRINASKSICINYDDNGTLQLAPEQQLILFRIVQEAIQNAIKHADPDTIDITTYEIEKSLKIIIRNNGKSFGDFSQGSGVINMRQRTTLLGGSIDWISSPCNVTEVKISLPLNSAQ